MAIRFSRCPGFTLVELIVGIVVMGIALAGVLGPYFFMMQSSVEPIFEAKGAILAQQITRRMSVVSYDENSDHDGGLCRCDEKLNLLVGSIEVGICPQKACTASASFGPDSAFEKNADDMDGLNDFDDFDTNAICSKTASSTVKGYCQKSEKISILCKDSYCVSAEYFVLSDFKNADELKKMGAMFDSGFKGFFVNIAVNETTFGKGNVFNPSAEAVKLKHATIAVISPQGQVYKYELYKGNY